MKKVMIIFLVFSALIFSSCDFFYSIFGSPDAYIITFSVQGSVGEAEIDNENRTVVITVEPMDISDISPDITISEGATITGPSSIEDGVAAVYTLTAENGDVLEWEVTINVQYGVSFTVEGQKVVLTGGIKDSGDSTANEACGNGVPGIQKIDGDGMALEQGLRLECFIRSATVRLFGYIC